MHRLRDIDTKTSGKSFIITNTISITWTTIL